MIYLLRLCFLACTLGFAVPALADAPPPPSETQEHLTVAVQKLSDRLAAVEKQVDAAHPSQALLNELATEAAPLDKTAQSIVEHLTPRVSAMKARLDQLGAKPEKGEGADITAERDTLEKSFAANDSLFKRAKVLALKAQQLTSYIGKRQRALFTTSLFQRSTTILSPPLWITVAREMPGNVAEATRAFRSWLDGFNEGLTGGRLVEFWCLVLGVILLYWPLTWAARRFITHEMHAEAPSHWQKLLMACWTTASVGGLMIAVMYAVVLVCTLAGTSDQRFAPLFLALQWGVIRLALAAGLSRGLLEPNRPRWRLLNLDDRTAHKLTRIVIGVVLIVSCARFFEALNEVVGASFDFTIAVRGIGALLVAAGLAAALADLGDDPETDTADAEASSPSQRRDLYSLVRGLAWTLILVITGAALIGYIAFASFLIEQLTLWALVGAVLYLLVKMLDDACAFGLQPKTRLGRTLIYTVGLRRETLDQLPVVLSGAGRLILFGLALLIVAAPWGMQSTDLASNFSAIVFGFKVGDFTISLANITVAIVSFLLILAGTRGIQNWLEDRYLPTTRLDSGLRNSIKTSLGYIGFIIALAIGAASLGLDFQKLAIVAGALSVGIGFGLQSIVNNFVSGLILLWERAVRVGDWVVVGSDQGYVRKINVRSTEIETFDRAAVIVPNSNLVSGVVKNLMRADRVGRLQIELSTHISADPEKVREVLLDISRNNESILALPSPQVRFTNVTAASMTFDLFCYVGDVEGGARVKSELYFEICKQFRRHGFFDGPPPDPTAIKLVNLDSLQAMLKSAAEPARAAE